MKEDKLIIEIFDPHINSDDIHRLFVELLNRSIPKSTELKIEVVD